MATEKNLPDAFLHARDDRAPARDPRTGPLVTAGCPCCGAASSRPATWLRSRLRECWRCGLVYVSPRLPESRIRAAYLDERLSREYLEQLYLPHEELRERVFDGYLDRIESLAPPRGPLIDVGSASGALLRRAVARGWKAIGFEPSPAAREHARRAGLDVRSEFFEEAALPEGEAACVTMLDVVEHSCRPLALIRRAAGCLAPGGILALLTPNWDCLPRRLLGSRWDAVVPDGHLVYFRKRPLEMALRQAGLRIEQSATLGLRGLNRRPRLRRIFERQGLGESLWVLARKAGR